MSQHLQDTINEKQNLTYQLNDIYALVEASRLALKADGSDEAECVVDVLYMAVEKLVLRIEQENTAIKKLEAQQQGGEK